MKKRIRLNKWMILLLIAVTIFAIIAVCKTLLANYVNIRGQHLNTYCYSSGGGMNGGYHSETVKRYSDHALISIESAEWHFQDPTVSEYLVDLAVMDELESVVRKYRMNFWNGKKFTNDFVYDGESEGYHFNFDQEDIFFSSQIYPLRYRKKLNELDRVIDKYIETGEKLPGLVNTNSKINEEENYFLPEGELVVYVYSYVKNSIRLRILNGTDEEIEIPENYQLINDDTGVILLEEDTPYGGIFSEQSIDEMDIKLEERLDVGHYKLIFGEMEILFEIR